ncbi:MAG: cytochrome c [Proteobacteria bacterium]|nr:cytochrome c [Pseudomonadota bacterium]
MKRLLSPTTVLLGLFTLALALVGLAGCTTTPASSTLAGGSSVPNAGAAKLWAQNCAHCHNIRTPSAYSDMQWDVVTLHMRVRGNLTAEEHRAILAFLKSAH